MSFYFHFIFIVAVFYKYSSSSGNNTIKDPSDFFAGAQHRPKLEIVYPDNGHILETGSLDIKIQVGLNGFEFPSKLHQTIICVCLSTGERIFEQCFDQAPDLIFHAHGLAPGAVYALRIVLYERGNAIAVSVRSFKVGGIGGLLESSPQDLVSISTAMQVALELQLRGMEARAESIYRSVLLESPANAEALHLLGVVFYQKGDPVQAIPYIQQALQTTRAGNKTHEEFYNSLGLCYRNLGRAAEAELQFRRALQINPVFATAMYNLGLAYQDQGRYEEAVAQFRNFSVTVRVHPLESGEITFSAAGQDQDLLLESKVRECDLLQLLDQVDLEESLRCWSEAAESFPAYEVIHNERGNILLQLGRLEEALTAYDSSFRLGSALAQINMAHVLELLGEEQAAREAFAAAIHAATNKSLPTYHLRVREAVVLPRVLPSSKEEFIALRNAVDDRLSALLLAASPSSTSSPAGEVLLEVDNSPPLFFGFSIGFHFLFHGFDSSIVLKTKLHRVYLKMCPALGQGYFMGALDSVAQKFGRRPVPIPSPGPGSGSGSGRRSLWKEAGGGNPSEGAGEAAMVPVSVSGLTGADDEPPALGLPSPGPGLAPGLAAPGQQQQHEEVDISRKVIRLGLLSRFLADNAVGLLCLGLLRALSGHQDQVRVTLFLIDGGPSTRQFDEVQRAMVALADRYEAVSSQDLNHITQQVRTASLDVLLYPEIGLDPVTYFLSFARMAPVQAAWFGHPDSTGVPTVDYFVSISEEVADAQRGYSERLHRMSSGTSSSSSSGAMGAAAVLGSQFADRHRELFLLHLRQPRTVLLDRAKRCDAWGLPKSAHLYVLASSACKLHSQFDDVFRRILRADKLAYFLLVDSSGPPSRWQRRFVARIVSSSTDGQRLFSLDEMFERMRFLSPAQPLGLGGPDHPDPDLLLRAIHIAHVVLDPFPVGGGSYEAALHSLSMGVPVITLPTPILAGRLTLALYGVMGLQRDDAFAAPASASFSATATSPIVSTINEYVTLALQLTHQPQLRSHYCSLILQQRYKLFQNRSDRIFQDWHSFMTSALINSSKTAVL